VVVLLREVERLQQEQQIRVVVAVVMVEDWVLAVLAVQV
jgi:hypothetical protein